MARWFVYLARCADDTLYCGITNDLAGRMIAHNCGKGAKYTARRGPVEVVFSRRCASKSFALRLEYAIKQLTRSEKDALIVEPARIATVVRRLRARQARAA